MDPFVSKTVSAMLRVVCVPVHLASAAFFSTLLLPAYRRVGCGSGGCRDGSAGCCSILVSAATAAAGAHVSAVKLFVDRPTRLRPQLQRKNNQGAVDTTKLWAHLLHIRNCGGVFLFYCPLANSTPTPRTCLTKHIY